MVTTPPIEGETDTRSDDRWGRLRTSALKAKGATDHGLEVMGVLHRGIAMPSSDDSVVDPSGEPVDDPRRTTKRIVDAGAVIERRLVVTGLAGASAVKRHTTRPALEAHARQAGTGVTIGARRVGDAVTARHLEELRRLVEQVTMVLVAHDTAIEDLTARLAMLSTSPGESRADGDA